MNEQAKVQAKEEISAPIVERLVKLLTNYYVPADTPAEADEQKDTQELIEEMSLMYDQISPGDVNALLDKHGFKMHYTGSGYVWLLKTK